MDFDFWYGHTFDDVTYADVSFYPNLGVYRGNLYKRARKENYCQNSEENDPYISGKGNVKT